MKQIVMLSLLVATSTTFASTTTELFSTAERKEVVRAIDDVCGDTWCEGEYNFKFNDFTCDKNTHTCELNFQFIRSDNAEVETFSPVQVCRFEHIKEFNQVMDTKYSLAPNFYDSVSDCIAEKEDKIKF